jgi:hypothetical protein
MRTHAAAGETDIVNMPALYDYGSFDSGARTCRSHLASFGRAAVS